MEGCREDGLHLNAMVTYPTTTERRGGIDSIFKISRLRLIFLKIAGVDMNTAAVRHQSVRQEGRHYKIGRQQV